VDGDGDDVDGDGDGDDDDQDAAAAAAAAEAERKRRASNDTKQQSQQGGPACPYSSKAIRADSSTASNGTKQNENRES